MAAALRIGEAARRIGISVDTIRFYESRALIPPPTRTPSRYRLFSPADIEQLNFIRYAQGLGFTLREIGQLVQAQRGENLACRAVRGLVQTKLRQLGERRRQLALFERELRAILLRCQHQAERMPCRSLKKVQRNNED